jgi:hypothetical protein
MVASARRNRRAAQHARQFLDTRRIVQRLDPGVRRACGHVLRYPQLPVGLGGHLRQVGHAQHLALRRERLELPADHLRHGAPDTRIDFVEHEAGQVRSPHGSDLQRQADA